MGNCCKRQYAGHSTRNESKPNTIQSYREAAEILPLTYDLKDMLGEELLKNAEGETVSVDTLAGKIVALYFSAHWCPPCRPFTPKLAQLYKRLQQEGRNFEIILVSSDRDIVSFHAYFKEMPWVAVPFTDRKRKEKLTTMFDVTGMPTVVILDENRRVITLDGRNEVKNDPLGEKFPWDSRNLPNKQTIQRPENENEETKEEPKEESTEENEKEPREKPLPTYNLKDILGDKLLKNEEESVLVDAIVGKTVAFYFSAHWCPPCRQFTPKLVQLYNNVKQSGKEFEIIFVSSDKDAASFKKYFKDMPWLALPFTDQIQKNRLANMFDASGMPTVVVLDENGSVITLDGRNKVKDDPQGIQFPWKEQ